MTDFVTEYEVTAVGDHVGSGYEAVTITPIYETVQLKNSEILRFMDLFIPNRSIAIRFMVRDEIRIRYPELRNLRIAEIQIVEPSDL